MLNERSHLWKPADLLKRIVSNNVLVIGFICGIEMTFLEASAMTGENVEEVFLKTARSILSKIEAGCVECIFIYTYIKCSCLGELDPERMGSGIQYGDRSLRKLTTDRRPRKQSDCSC